MPNTPSYLELCVKLYIGQENLIKHLPCKYVTSDLRLYSVYIDCQCCYSVCKPDIDLVLVVHPVERPARAYRNTSRAPRGRCLDPHVQVFLLDEHLGRGRYPIHLNNSIFVMFIVCLTLLHLERQKLYRVLAFRSPIGLIWLSSDIMFISKN